MHKVFNAVTGKQGYGLCDICCKGICKRISEAEKEIWYDDHVDIFWQKKDSEVIKDTADKFVEHKNTINGEDLWVIFYSSMLPPPKRD